MPKKAPSRSPEVNALVVLLNIWTIYAALAMVGLWLDHKFHKLPLFTSIAFILGLIYFLCKARQMYKDEHKR